jgi:hypothetical protein
LSKIPLHDTEIGGGFQLATSKSEQEISGELLGGENHDHDTALSSRFLLDDCKF